MISSPKALQNFNLDLFHNPKIRASILVGTLMILAIIIWSLNRGIVMLDEAFYLLHLEGNAYPIAISSWFVLAKPFSGFDLLHLRIIIFTWLALSAFFLGYSFSSYWDFGWPAWFSGILTVLAHFVLAIPVQYVPNNVTFNILFIYTSLGFLFLALSMKGNKPKVWFFLLLSGFCLGFLPFVMVTNSPMIGVVLVMVFLFFWGSQSFTHTMIWFLGVLLAIACFFIAFQSPEVFIADFSSAMTFSQYLGSHGLRPLIQWHVDTLIYFLGMPLALALVLYFWANESINEKTWNNILIKILGVILLLTLLIIDLISRKGVFSSSLFYILVFATTLILLAKKVKWDPKYLSLVLLAVIPYFATLGTDVPFQVRTSGYFAVLILLVTAMLQVIPLKKFKLFFLFLLGIVFLNFLSYPFREGWARYKLVAQTEKYTLPNGKGHVQLSPKVFENTTAISPYLSGKSQVVISHPNLWGYLYLSGGQALNLHFMPNEAYIRYLIREKSIQVNTLTLVEGKLIPFSDNFKSEILAQGIFERIDLGELIVYRPVSHE